MSDDVIRARNTLARLYRNKGEPDADQVAAAKANLATSFLDREIRIRTTEVLLDDANVGHLVGLLLMQAGAAGADVTEIESLARFAVRKAQKA